ncbi:MAG TPA: enoyl-CoA hydratase/isomerase family protein [Beijerinckiaceae bacterium]|jgi:enoyl-CoA hydratase/carnithine racemase|nr:enoyl-CoA hydratase/isomerase family protein [Beijerinckiaceae bacterium]
MAILENSSVRSMVEGPRVTLTIDRAERGNMLTLPMIGQLSRHLRSLPRDAKLVHLVATGPDFCCGRDPQGNPQTANALDMRAALVDPILDFYEALAECPVPIVCGVRGRAHGLGAALAGACDITIAGTAGFRLPEMEKDLPPTLAMSVLVPRIGLKALALLIYGMEEIDSVTAAAIGLVSRTVPDAELDLQVEHLIETMLARSRPALVAVKDYLRAAPGLPARQNRDFAGNLLAAVLSSAER